MDTTPNGLHGSECTYVHMNCTGCNAPMHSERANQERNTSAARIRHNKMLSEPFVRIVMLDVQSWCYVPPASPSTDHTWYTSNHMGVGYHRRCNADIRHWLLHRTTLLDLGHDSSLDLTYSARSKGSASVPEPRCKPHCCPFGKLSAVSHLHLVGMRMPRNTH